MPHSMSHIPINLSRLPDSNNTLVDLIRLLAVELPQFLVSSSGGEATEVFLVTVTGGQHP